MTKPDNSICTEPRPWHHRPAHVYAPSAAYIITASTYMKKHFFDTPEKLHFLQATLCEVFHEYSWWLQAWAVFPNHYHAIAISTDEGKLIRTVIQRLHSQTSRHLNQLDRSQGRRIWHQYWDTCLTNEASYFARLNYVMNNPVRHGLVAEAGLYPYCSAGWFRANANNAYRKKVESFRYDRVKIPDDF